MGIAVDLRIKKSTELFICSGILYSVCHRASLIMAITSGSRTCMPLDEFFFVGVGTLIWLPIEDSWSW
jgi:hypothetical protein